MILLVDNTIEGVGSSPREIRSALERVEPDMRVVSEPFQNVTPEFVRALAPSHIILSGQSHPWDKYEPRDLAGIFMLFGKLANRFSGFAAAISKWLWHLEPVLS